jgi:hypothetical protein
MGATAARCAGAAEGERRKPKIDSLDS